MSLGKSVLGQSPFGIASTGIAGAFTTSYDTLYLEIGHNGNASSAGGWSANTLYGTLMSPNVNVAVTSLGFEASHNGVGQTPHTSVVSVGLHKEGGALIARVDVPSQSYAQGSHYIWTIPTVYLRAGKRYWFTTMSSVDGTVAYANDGIGSATPHTHSVQFATFTLTQGNTKQAALSGGYDINSLITSNFINDTYHSKHIIGLATVDPALTITERSRRSII